ncbi:hypothetical protein FDUTEX481_01586 [Tolypothrix sp. PCC 7601]|nr:hypothetical protein FDUTEX481_01586 [Tolypothrix sp. PCC 7601]
MPCPLEYIDMSQTLFELILDKLKNYLQCIRNARKALPEVPYSRC